MKTLAETIAELEVEAAAAKALRLENANLKGQVHALEKMLELHRALMPAVPQLPVFPVFPTTFPVYRWQQDLIPRGSSA
jgi:hypothetical protein